jgi:hypothetical protein
VPRRTNMFCASARSFRVILPHDHLHDARFRHPTHRHAKIARSKKLRPGTGMRALSAFFGRPSAQASAGVVGQGKKRAAVVKRSLAATCAVAWRCCLSARSWSAFQCLLDACVHMLHLTGVRLAHLRCFTSKADWLGPYVNAESTENTCVARLIFLSLSRTRRKR